MLTSIYKRKGREGVTLAYEDPVTLRIRQKQFRAKDGRTAKERALEFAGEQRAKAKQPPVVDSDVTFPEYAARWLRATKTAVRAGTYRNYESNVRVHLALAFPGRLAEISSGKVRDFIVQLREAKLKKKYVSNVRGTLHACLEAAIEEGLLKTNPAHFRSKSKLLRLATSIGEQRAKVKAFDVGQARAFFAAAPGAAPLHAMKWRTMVATGLRPGEAAALRPEDLDYRALRIRLERALTRGSIGPCKTNAAGEVEHVDMPAGLVKELKSWETRLSCEALANGRPRSEWLFPSSAGGLLDEKGSRDAFKRTLKRAGLPGHFSQHSLRHTYATHQLNAGVPIQYVSRQLRHKDIRMTFTTYGSHLPNVNREAADQHYERLFGERMSQARHKP